MTTITELDLIDRALAEDVGEGDATTEATVDASVRGRATITQKAPGVISGLAVAEAVFLRLDPDASIERLGPEGEWREGGPVLRIEGSARALLTAERTALNFLGRLSGVATKTARIVRSVGTGGAGSPRHAQDDAGPADAREGGGRPRRWREPPDRPVRLHPDQGEPLRAGGRRGRAPCGARGRRGRSSAWRSKFRDAAEIDEALAANAQRMLLDNYRLDQVRAAVAQVRAARCSKSPAASTRRQFWSMRPFLAVDFVSIGALTHSAPVLDLSLILETVQ